MMKRIVISIFILCPAVLFSQKTTTTTNRTFQVGYLIDSTIKKNQIFTEFGFGKASGLFGHPPMLGNRSLVIDLETSFRVGFFPARKLLIGMDFSPRFTFSDLKMEGFRWSAGPFLRYYFPIYRVTKRNELKSPLAFYVFFNSYFGQYNPIVLDRPFDPRFTAGFSVGVGLSVRLKRNLCLNIEIGPRYDFFAAEFANQRLSTLFKISLSYSFPTKKETALKKYNRINKKVSE